MMRKIMIALVSAAAVAALAAPSEVAARGWHRHGGWHGSWHGGWYGPGWGYYRYPYAAYPYYYGYYGCYRNVRVMTPFGWAWRRVWVCG